MTMQVTITAAGRMSLPAGIRRRLGVAGGGIVHVEETDNGVILRTTAQIVAQAQALARRYATAPGASVDEFLAARASDSGA